MKQSLREIKKARKKDHFTKQQLLHLKNCINDPIYFCRNFVQIKTPVEGIMPFDLYQYQERFIKTVMNNRFVCALMPRQSGKTEAVVGYMLWRAMYKENQTILIVANKQSQALEIVKRIKFSYENLPDYIRAGAWSYNLSSVEFDTGSTIISRATTADAARGLSVSLLYADEFAYVRPGIASEFWASTRPTLATGGSCIITSTPNNDEDEFAQIWNGANDTLDDYGNENPKGLGRNGFKAFKVNWEEHPKRDEEWARGEKMAIGEERWRREYMCEFVSIDDTLINSLKLMLMQGTLPLYTMGDVRFYRPINPSKIYLVGLDPSMGIGQNNAAIQVFQLPEMVQIAEWMHNRTDIKGQIKVLMQILTYIKSEMTSGTNGNEYPEIYWTFENNAVGEAALVVIEDTGEEEFPGYLISEPQQKGNTRRFRKGLNTTNKKKVEAAMFLKSIIESNRAGIYSKPFVRELKNYVAKGIGFEAKQGETDDLISAALLVMRLTKMLRTWDSNVNERINESLMSDNETMEPMPTLVLTSI